MIAPQTLNIPGV